jgi:two-component system, LuxR family, sensor kinase FixL
MIPAGSQIRVVPSPLVTGLLWIAGIGAVDWWAEPNLLTSVLYLPGIVSIAWHHGRRVGMGASAFAAVVWLTADLHTHHGYSHAWITAWNGFSRLLVFGTVAWLVSEIRARQIVERSLNDQKSILRSVLDSMSEGVVVSEGEGKIIHCNPSAMDFFGGDLEGKDLYGWLDGEFSKMGGKLNIKRVSQRPTKGADHVGEMFIHRGNQPTRLLGLSVQPLWPESGTINGVVMVFTDLTVRRKLEREVANSAETERRRIGQDLHDGICQELVGVRLATESVQLELEKLGLDELANSVAEVANMVKSTNHRAKDLARGLFPAGLEESLVSALKSLVGTVSQRSSMACSLELTNQIPDQGREIDGQLYLIIQEAVVNAESHSQADSIRIIVTSFEKELVFEVIDDGIGIGNHEAGSGIGQSIMKYRASLIGADLEIRSSPESGTYVRCRMPFPIKHFHQSA